MVFTGADYEKFRTLRITHLARAFEELITDEANDGLLPEQLFLTATDEALAKRRATQIERRIKAAGFPIPEATIAEVDYRAGRNLNPITIKRYAATNWSTTTRNLLLISPTGGGKTYLACAIGNAACHNGHTVTYTRMDQLARELTLRRNDVIAHHKLLTDLTNHDLLIIDDFLTVGINSETASDLFTILADREHRAATIIASQTGPAQWVTELPDKVAGDSIVNRLANNGKALQIGNIDMRAAHRDTQHQQASHH